MVEIDWVKAQENEEYIAAKSLAFKLFPDENIQIERGYGPIDFILTRENEEKLYIDVTSLADVKIANYESSTLYEKLNKLPHITKKGDVAKVVLYNYCYNSEIFINASNLDDRIFTVENSYIQKLFASRDVNVDFLKPTKRPEREFTFQDTSKIMALTCPREEAIKNIVFKRKNQ